MLREKTSRGLCGLVCPSRKSERGGEGDCVKEGGGGEWKCLRDGACIGAATMLQPSTLRLILNAAALAAVYYYMCVYCVCLLLQYLLQSGTREEPGTFNTGWRPVFPGSSRLGIEPKTPRWLVQSPTTSPSGDLIPTIRGSGVWRVCVYYCRAYYKAVCGGERGTVKDMCYEVRRAEACVD